LGLAQAFLASLPFVDKPQKARHAYGLQEKLKPNSALSFFARFARQKRQGIASAEIAKIGAGKVWFLFLLGLGLLLLLGFFLFFLLNKTCLLFVKTV